MAKTAKYYQRTFAGQKKIFDMVKDSLREGEHFFDHANNMFERYHRKNGTTCFYLRMDMARMIMKRYYPEWAKENHYI